MKYQNITNINRLIVLISVFLILSCATYKLKTDKNLVSGQLENGLKYYIYPNRIPEKAVYMGILFNVGSLNEEDHERGLAHYLEHMAFKGTEDYPGSEGVLKVLKKFGMSFGADINAYTTFDKTYYSLNVPDGNNEAAVDEALNILNNWASKMELNKSEIEKERNIIIEEKKRGESYPGRIIERIFKFILGNSRYVDRFPIGLEDRILSFKSEDFKKFYKKWYRPELTSVIIVGDIDPSKIEEKIKEKFSSFKKPKSEKEKININLDTVMNERFISIEDFEIPFPSITFVKKDIVVPISTSNHIKKNIERVLLNSLFTNRFSELKASGINYFMSFNKDDFSKKSDDNYILINKISIDLNPDSLKEGIEEFFYQFKRINKFGFTQGEVDKVKAQLISFYKLSKDNIGNRDSSTIINILVDIAAENSYMLDMHDYYDIAIEHLNKVSLATIAILAKGETSINDKAIIYSYSNKSHFDLTFDKIQEIQELALKREIKPYEDVLIQGKFLKEDLVSKEIIDNKEFFGGISSFTLENGVEVYFKHNEYKRNIVTLSASSWGGLINENADLIPVLAMAPAVVSNSGYGDYSQLQVEKYLADKVVSLNTAVNFQQTSLSGSAEVKNIETLFELIYFIFNKSKVDDIVLQNTISDMEAVIKSREEDSKYIFRRAINGFYNNDDYRYRDIKKSDLKNMKKEILLDFYKKRFTYANNFKFVFVGDIDLDTIKILSKKYLGNLNTKKLNEFKDLDYSYKKDAGRIVVRKGKDSSSIVYIFYPFEFNYTPKIALNYYALTSLLTDSLVKNIRRDMSSVYSINAYFDYSVRQYKSSDGFIVVNFTVEPKVLDKVLKSVYEYMLKRQKIDYTEEDFNYVKKNIIKEEKIKSQSNWYWASLILDSVLWTGTFEDTISTTFIENNLNKDIINSFLKKINFNQKTEIVLMPEKDNYNN
ncbi:insulinase family protein [Borrelia sp. A-FGy1]|uniref:M16 family metallopeptidase n=1 Tax=Borrelia sp. A-FGy1 TaxID=2608247 RepID=UPI0015F43B37|nr:insulinase family protein [Borrelia sp. A-FGy1]QMU99301.1 insulinase family protein [Borrelia sp. A-FGy1]